MAISPMTRPDAGGFLPKEYVERRSEAKFYIVVFLLFMVVMTGVAGAFLVTQQRWNEVRQSQTQINAMYEQEQVKLKELRNLESQRAEMLDKAKITSSLLEPVPRSVLMAELVGRLPEGATLFVVGLEAERAREEPRAPAAARDRAKPKSGTLSKGAPPAEAKPKIVAPKFVYTLTLDGVCSDNKLVADYLTSLQASPLLSSVELEFIETKIINSEAYRGFRMTAILRDNANALEVEAATQVERDALASVQNEEG